jgi:hypothetical protein
MRRLLLVSFSRMMAFTRNPSVRLVLEKTDTPLNTGKAGGISIFSEFSFAGPQGLRLVKD